MRQMSDDENSYRRPSDDDDNINKLEFDKENIKTQVSKDKIHIADGENNYSQGPNNEPQISNDGNGQRQRSDDKTHLSDDENVNNVNPPNDIPVRTLRPRKRTNLNEDTLGRN